MAYTETKISGNIVSSSLNFIANYLRESGNYPDLDSVVSYAKGHYAVTADDINYVVTADDINYVAGTITSIYPDLSSYDEALKAYTYAFIPVIPAPAPGISRNMLLLGGAILLLLLLPKKSGETETPAEV
jgi:hypothetical protein